MEVWIIFIIAGLAAGFLAGLLGIGGGFVVVPVLVFVLPRVGIALSDVAHFAIGTSLLCICVTSLASTWAHQKMRAIDWPLFKIILPGLIIGSLAGVALAAVLKGEILLLLYVGGAFATAFYLLSAHQPSPHPDQKRWPFIVYGHFTGVLSALIGIGGGSVLVPFLVYKGKDIVKAVATAAACGFPIALFAAIGYALAGEQKQLSVEYASGYLYWPAFLGIVVFSSLSAPWGAKVAHLISQRRLRQTFALFLFFTGGQIIYSQWF